MVYTTFCLMLLVLLIAGALGMQRNYQHTSKRAQIGFQNIYNELGKLRGLSDVLLVNINKRCRGYLVFFFATQPATSFICN